MNDATLLQACRILFGEDIVIGEGFLAYLQPGGLKNAYRSRARQTHPDALHAGNTPDHGDFHAVQRAYALLSDYLDQRDGITPFSENEEPEEPRVYPYTPNRLHGLQAIAPIIFEPGQGSRSARPTIDRLYRGPVPARGLLFGHFLYYNGLTTWRTITAILVQQQRDRPRFGELGTRLGLLHPEDISRILAARTARRPFGEIAVALGLLNRHQQAMVLNQQRRQQKKFGALLVEKELITLKELTLLLTHFRSHNRAHGTP